MLSWTCFWVLVLDHLVLEVNQILCQFQKVESLNLLHQRTQILWNHSYSWGPMFMDFQNFTCLWTHDFMGKCMVALQCKTIHYFVNIHGDVNSRERVTHEIHKHWTPHEQWWTAKAKCKLVISRVFAIQVFRQLWYAETGLITQSWKSLCKSFLLFCWKLPVVNTSMWVSILQTAVVLYR